MPSSCTAPPDANPNASGRGKDDSDSESYSSDSRVVRTPSPSPPMPKAMGKSRGRGARGGRRRRRAVKNSRKKASSKWSEPSENCKTNSWSQSQWRQWNASTWQERNWQSSSDTAASSRDIVLLPRGKQQRTPPFLQIGDLEDVRAELQIAQSLSMPSDATTMVQIRNMVQACGPSILQPSMELNRLSHLASQLQQFRQANNMPQLSLTQVLERLMR
mmetsp:Transcript_42530/g.67280  ORF Transcript_42530/g.67280 Transcript_42530/m.67280 type:complete len:217 (+) Transcript_42530:33-683(+)